MEVEINSWPTNFLGLIKSVMKVIYQKNHGIITASTVYTYIELQKSSNGPFTPESDVRTAPAKNI